MSVGGSCYVYFWQKKQFVCSSDGAGAPSKMSREAAAGENVIPGQRWNHPFLMKIADSKCGLAIIRVFFDKQLAAIASPSLEKVFRANSVVTARSATLAATDTNIMGTEAPSGLQINP